MAKTYDSEPNHESDSYDSFFPAYILLGGRVAKQWEKTKQIFESDCGEDRWAAAVEMLEAIAKAPVPSGGLLEKTQHYLDKDKAYQNVIKLMRKNQPTIQEDVKEILEDYKGFLDKYGWQDLAKNLGNALDDAERYNDLERRMIFH